MNHSQFSLDDLEIISPLGRGAYSVVYKVKTRSKNEFYALKVVNKSNPSSTRVTKRLENEISLQRSLSHKNIVQLLKSFEDQDNFYLLLELCSGGDLFSYLKSSGKLEESEAKKICGHVVEGISYLHSRNILHRDLKLGNILLTEDKTAKIADFGLATQLRDLSEERNTLCGTPNYISPEIVSRRPYGLSSDLWSLGCILFACLTGHPPFDSPSIQDTLLKLKDMKLFLPQDLSSEAADLIQDLLNWDPQKRLNIFQVKEHFFFKGKKVPALQILDISPIRSRAPVEYSESMESSRFVPSRNYVKSLNRPRNFSANKENLPVRNNEKFAPVSTKFLKPFVHVLNHGKLEITEDGWMKVQIKSRVLEVSPDGVTVFYMGNLVDLKNLKKTPAKMLRIGTEFLQVLRSKTPKVVVEEQGARCMLMSNSPFPNFEVDFHDGCRVRYQVGSDVFLVTQPDGKEIEINPYLDQRNKENRLQRVLEIAMDGLKKCLAKEKHVI
jgi:polo-like kinase 4